MSTNWGKIILVCYWYPIGILLVFYWHSIGIMSRSTHIYLLNQTGIDGYSIVILQGKLNYEEPDQTNN